MKNIFNVLTIICILLFYVANSASEEHIATLRPGGFANDVLPLPRSGKIQNSKSKIQKSQNCTNGIIDTLTWRDPYASNIVNFGFDFGDSMLVWLQPTASCSLIAIRFKPMNWEGNMLLDVWDASNYDPIIYPDTGFHSIDCLDNSPLGWSATDPDHHYWGPLPYTVVQAHANRWIEIPADLGLQGEIDLGNKPFFIGAVFFKTDGWGFYSQRPLEGGIPYSLLKYHFRGVTSDSLDACWKPKPYQIWFEAIVKYYEHIPPSIYNMKVQNDTYHPGPFLIDVLIQAPDKGPGPAPRISAILHFEINGAGDENDMSGLSAGGIFQGEIPEILVEDTVTYWVEAFDSTFTTCQSDRVTFTRIEPENPAADILIIWDCGIYSDPAQDSFVVDLFATLDSTYAYELWNIAEHNGIDASVTNWGWNTIYISGWGSGKTLPGYEYEGNIFTEWLEAGTTGEPHNLLYIDQDYFCVQETYGCDWDEQLTEGDFMHDYFGIELAISDNHGSDTPGYDSVAIGMRDFEGIEINFSPNAWDPVFPESNLWPDMIAVTTNDAELIMHYKDHHEYGAGVRLDRGHYKTVYIPWQDFFAVDSLENGDLVPRSGLTALMTRIFELLIDPMPDEIEDRNSNNIGSPAYFSLYQNYPNPFNSVTDIKYQIPDDKPSSPTTLKIYNILGQEVKALVDEFTEPGIYTVPWDGKDFKGRNVGSGVYFYQLKTGGFVNTQRMLLLK